VQYIAEGFKRNRNRVAICNSDDAVLQLTVCWLAPLTEKPLSLSVQYHADQDLAQLRAFWGDALGVGSDSIRFRRKSNSAQLKGRRWRSAHGVLTVAVSDTLARARLQAWTDRLKDEWAEKSG
jgi:hypothetical protein